VPEFVREDDAEYALTHAGEQLVGDAVSGTYTDADTTTLDPTPVSDCPEPDCDGRIEAQYEHREALFGCDTCDERRNLIPAPPIIVESHSRERALEVAGRCAQLVLERNNRGFCQLCDGPVTAHLPSHTSTTTPSGTQWSTIYGSVGVAAKVGGAVPSSATR